MNKNTGREGLGFVESIALLALLISLTALAIDIMLPALPVIGRDLGVRHANEPQLIISALVFGMSFGQIFYGPVSDSAGRKPLLIVGVVLFIFGSALSLFSTTFPVMLVGRVLQGMGLAGPRSLVPALIRDQYQGQAMAKMMSSIMAVFIIIPAIAPAIGQGVLAVAGWRTIFALLLAQALIALPWFMVRQPETLRPEKRIPFSMKRVVKAVAEICCTRVALGYTLVTGCILGAFFGYLNSAQQIFQETYQLGNRFPIIFGILALSIGGASFVNARIVMRFNMLHITRSAMLTLNICAFFLLFCFLLMDVRLPLWFLMIGLMIIFFCFGLLFGNLNAIAMTPLGHIAGTGSAVIGSLSTFISVPLAIAIGWAYDGTPRPLIGSFAVLSLISLCIMRWADGKTPDTDTAGRD